MGANSKYAIFSQNMYRFPYIPACSVPLTLINSLELFIRLGDTVSRQFLWKKVNIYEAIYQTTE
jgi:hypothetical protein